MTFGDWHVVEGIRLLTVRDCRECGLAEHEGVQLAAWWIRNPDPNGASIRKYGIACPVEHKMIEISAEEVRQGFGGLGG
jgi:hypothetical protein